MYAGIYVCTHPLIFVVQIYFHLTSPSSRLCQPVTHNTTTARPWAPRLPLDLVLHVPRVRDRPCLSPS